MATSRFGELGLIVTNSHPCLGREVAACLGITPLEVESRQFDNGELDVRRLCDVSGRDICIFSSLHSRYDTIGELRRLCNSVQGAARIFGVFPFVRDGKSDHTKRHGESVAYEETAFQISSSGIEVVAIFDQHSSQHPGFYDKRHYNLRKVHHVYLMRVLIEYALAHSDEIDAVLTLDAGGLKRNAIVASMLEKPVAFINKYRDPITRQVIPGKSMVIGDIKDMRVAAFDDMLQEGGTLALGAEIAKLKGAKSISFFVVHNDFSPNTWARINPLLESGMVDKVYTLGTLPLLDKEKWHPNMVVLSPAELIAEVIDRIHYEKHMRKLFLEV